ncbi:MAG: C13 family peptidase [Moraxella sp.]|nr:C13 family peptidase [Moraxella sp.]
MSLSTLKVNLLQRFSLNFAANITAALWMLIGSIRAFNWIKPTISQFLCFSVLALLANILFAWLAADMGSEFNEQGLISYLIFPVIMLVTGIILAKRSQNYALVFVPAILWLAADTMLVLFQSFIQFLGIQGFLPTWLHGSIQLLFMLLFVWQTAALLWVFAKRLSWPWWEQMLMLAGAIAMLIVWQKNVSDQPIFKIQESPPSISEDAFYLQPTLLTEALTDVAQGELGESEWYFMGVAGYAGQNVFASEIEQARQLFDLRFGTQGRSISLVNNVNTWQHSPVASRTSIQAALKDIGSKMNTEEDVLFLTLSSHGIIDDSNVPTGEIELANPPLQLEPIDGAWLKEALDASGIRWRVIVVSACYSGAFIEPLSSPTTAIITASSADNPSFGCTNEADLTYFGRAFFAESMREQTTFANVFTHTQRRVAEREALMGFAPSEPQMAVGALMQTALPELEKVLFGFGVAPDNPNTKDSPNTDSN